MVIYLYLLGINVISSILFICDKKNAEKQRHRVKESHLHMLEILGGIFSIFPLIFLIKHKNKKPSYYIISLLIITSWIIGSIYLYNNLYVIY
ncbi:MAG: DUF1294 domain-containing protein [Crenarchaeota archaeon]|nr:DUF1294 domain-containing protein [Thermoproteota archaeon]OQA84253.1 MAG: DMSO reductase anchor subunit (DmsC) [Bacteroidetes bacterium ADurb.Bin234]